MVLPDAQRSVRSLLCASTNITPHERFLSFPRRSMLGKSLPSWLTTPGPVFLRRFVRASKNESICDEVELLKANPNFVQIRYPDGRESTVALKDLAPCLSFPHLRQNLPCELSNTGNINPSSSIEENRLNNETTSDIFLPPPVHPLAPIRESHISLPEPSSALTDEHSVPPSPTPLRRRSSRLRRAPDRYGDCVQ